MLSDRQHFLPFRGKAGIGGVFRKVRYTIPTVTLPLPGRKVIETRRIKAAGLGIASLLVATNTAVHSQGTKDAVYPVKPIRLVVPYFPGGTPDIQGRRLGEKLRERL